jgi:RNA polymerase sigma-70 factor, ECF subfamily
MALSDEALMGKVQARDACAFEALYARYRDRVRGHLMGVVRDPAAAEDLVQEVFLRLWTHAEQWEARGSFPAWIFRIATNLALNHRRSVGRRREQRLDSPEEAAADEESLVPGWMIDAAALGPEVALERSEQRLRLRRLIDTLPEEKRDVFRMVCEQEMEIRDVAEALGIPEGTVKSRLHHARKRLARAWVETEEE